MEEENNDMEVVDFEPMDVSFVLIPLEKISYIRKFLLNSGGRRYRRR